MEKQNNITENLCFNCFPASQVHNAKIHGKQPRDETILPGTCHLGVYFIVYGKKQNKKKHGKHCMGKQNITKSVSFESF